MKRYWLIILMSVSVMLLHAQISVWDGLTPTADANCAFSGGDGSQQNPYQIGSAANLAQLAVNVTSGVNLYTGVYFVLTVDIDLGGNYDASTQSWGGNVWGPIGTTPSSASINVFRGHFDGAYHEIHNMYVNVGGRAGLFGEVKGTISNRASVKNVRIMSGYVLQDAFFHVHTGSVCGYAEYADFENCVNYADVYSPWVAGGIVGGAYQGTNITSCVNYGNVDCGTGKWAGGIAGVTEGLGISYSVNLGRVTGTTYVGGIVSFMEYYDPQVDYCINAGAVVGDSIVGSVVGERTIFKRFGIVDTIGDIFGCLYLGQNSALTGVGNWPDSVMTIRSSALDLHNGVAYSGRFGAGFTDENWCFECDIVPMPIGVYPMTINNVTDFIAFRDAVNAGSQGQFKGVMNVNGFENQIVILRTDIDLQSVMNWQPIGTQTNPFKGQFIGLNHSVSNVQVQGMAHAALFGHVESATIGRVHVVSGAIQGSTQAAGLVAVAQDSEVLNCSNGASILSGSNGGGVVALALGNTSVKGCLNSGTVSVSAGGSFLGGVLGFAGIGAQVDVERCMNSGLIYSLYAASQLSGVVGGVASGVVLSVTASVQAGQLFSVSGSVKYAIAGTAQSGAITHCYVEQQMSLVSGQGNNLTQFQSNGATTVELLQDKYWSDVPNCYRIPFTMNQVVNAQVAASRVVLSTSPIEFADGVASDIEFYSGMGVNWYNVTDQRFIANGNMTLTSLSASDTIWLRATDGASVKECVLLKQIQAPVVINLLPIDTLCVNDRLMLVPPVDIPAGFTGSWELSYDGFSTLVSQMPSVVSYQHNGAQIRYNITDGSSVYYSNSIVMTVREPVTIVMDAPASICDNSALVLPNVAITAGTADMSSLKWVIVKQDGSRYYYNNQPLSDENLSLYCTVQTECGEVSSNSEYIWFNTPAVLGTFTQFDAVAIGDVLNPVAPQVTLNDVQLINAYWQMSNDGFVTYAIYNGETATLQHKGYMMRYVIETTCGELYSNELAIRLIELPSVGTLIQPAVVCDDDVLMLEIPEIDAEGVLNEGWQVCRSAGFENPIAVSEEELNSALYSGYYCRYFVENSVGVTYSNGVQLGINIAANSLIRVDNYSLQFVWTGSYQQIEWYHDGVKVEGANSNLYTQTGALTGSYYVVVVTLDGRRIESCEFVMDKGDLKFTLKLVPNPAKHMQPLQVIIEGLDADILHASKLQVYSMSGILVKNMTDLRSINDMVLPQGEYVVVVTTPAGNYQYGKLIVRN